MQITTNNNNTAVSLQPEFKDVRDKIYLRMMCGEHKEILQFIPHIMLEDMAVIFFILPEPEPQNTSRAWETAPIVSFSDLELWGVSKESLFKTAMENDARDFPAVIDTLANRLMLLNGEEPGEIRQEKGLIYVLTNTKMFLGASCILYPGIPDKIAKRLEGSYYVIPSSIHEMLLIPESEMIDTGEMRSIVREINASEVLVRSEVLSDNIYYYDAGKKCLRTV
ncbi:MAG: hypothetical protein IJV14_04280 [Lachnospiraceae bacterium]|nr:hypothetical protein [Lachnospiraceae bacterium]